MSGVKLEGNALGTGVFTIKSPNSNTDRTFDLPDSSGTLLNNNSDITSQVKTATNASGDAPVYSCRAWVNFNGTGTVAIRSSGNVSSITDNGTGDYTVNFTTAMPDADYSAVSNLGTATTTTTSTPLTAQPSGTGTTAFSTTGYRLWSRQGATVADTSLISVAIFR